MMKPIKFRSAIDKYLDQSFSDQTVIDLPKGKRTKAKDQNIKSFGDILAEKIQ